MDKAAHTSPDITPSEYAARMEVFKLLLEYVSNGAMDDLRVQYGYLAPDIFADIQNIAIALPSSLANNSLDIVVRKRYSTWVGEIQERRLFLNMELLAKEHRYNRRIRPDKVINRKRTLHHTFVSTVGDRVCWDGSYDCAERLDLQINKRYDFRATICEHRHDENGKYTSVKFLKLADDLTKAADASPPAPEISGEW